MSMGVEVTANVNFLSGGGEMGHRIRSTDWSQTSLGPVHQWPPCLKIGLSIMLRSGYPMFIWWGKDLIMFHNDAYLPVLGKKHPEALGKSARLMWAEIWQQVGPLAETVFGGKEVYLQDLLMYLGRKGFLEETYWTFSYSPIINEEGEVGGLFCACNEETRKIIGQRRLKTLQEITGLSMQFKNAEEVSRAAIDVLAGNIHDIPFSLLYLVNKEKTSARLVKTFGIDSSALPTTVALQDNQSDFWKLQTVLKSRKPIFIDGFPEELTNNVQIVRGDIHSVCTLPLQRSTQDQLPGFLVCGLSSFLEFNEEYQNYLTTTAAQISSAISDVKAFKTERKRVEALLELARSKNKAEQDIHNLFMQAPVGILILEGQNYVIKLVNDFYLPVVQRRHEDMIGKPIFEALPEVEHQGFREIMDKVLLTGQPFFHHEHKTRLHRNGHDEDTYLNIVYQPLKELDGTINRIMILVNEVTEQVLARKKMEELNRVLEEEVEARTKDLKQANTELERSNKELEQFAYAASHDMQEPLRKIQTFASFLTDTNKEPLSETNIKYISKIQESAKRMSGIINDLLNYSYQSNEKKLVTTDLNKVVADVIFDLELLITQKNAQISYTDLPVLQAVPSQMHQLFYNLLNNSLKFSKPDVQPVINITCTLLQESSTDSVSARISVKDNGIGFEPEYADKIFQLFRRLNDRHSFSGSGIGLALCKKIVTNHNGTINTYSEVNRGANFVITLPLEQ